MKHEAVIGWIGFVFVIGVYAAVSFGFVLGTSLSYILGNMVAALCLGYASFKRKSWPAVFFYSSWLAISCIALI